MQSCCSKLFSSAFFLEGIAVAQSAFAQLSGRLGNYKTFPENEIIVDFQQDEEFYNFVRNGGQLKVQEEGLYYVYAQVFFENYGDAASIYHNRVALMVNDKIVALLQTGIKNKADYGSEYTGRIVKLKVGDVVYLKTAFASRIWVTFDHTFFGAYSIDANGC